MRLHTHTGLFLFPGSSFRTRPHSGSSIDNLTEANIFINLDHVKDYSSCQDYGKEYNDDLHFGCAWNKHPDQDQWRVRVGLF